MTSSSLLVLNNVRTLLAMVTLLVLIGYDEPYIMTITPLLSMFVWLIRYYIRAAWYFKRKNAALISPVYGLVVTTTQGLPVIRSLRDSSRWITAFAQRGRAEQKSFVTLCAGTRWLALNLDFIAWMILTCVVLISIKLGSSAHGASTVARIGLIISYSKQLLGNVNVYTGSFALNTM